MERRAARIHRTDQPRRSRAVRSGRMPSEVGNALLLLRGCETNVGLRSEGQRVLEFLVEPSSAVSQAAAQCLHRLVTIVPIQQFPVLDESVRFVAWWYIKSRWGQLRPNDISRLPTSGEYRVANMPIGSLHSFKNASNKPAKMLISVAPAGLEKMFLEVGQPVEPGATTVPPPSREEIEKLLAIAPRYGIEIRVPHH